MNGEVRLIENFVSWQGEGPDSGSTMVILRFKTCNLNCPWCDTAVKMRISAEAPYQLFDIQETLYERCAGILVTGGEPTVDRHFDETVMLLNELEYPNII
jgi:organic radical activating enzyme